MFRALQDHPEVLPLYPKAQKNLKSPHYFDLNYAVDRVLVPLPLPQRTAAALARRSCVPRREASPYYMFHPLGASRLTAELPDVRLLVLLRNPVDRGSRTTGTV